MNKTKRLELSESLKEKIRAAVGADIDFSKIAAYESVGASTRPLTQRNTAYHQAVMSQAFLQQMVDALARETVPIQILHDGQMLPIGKVFDAGVFDAEEGHHDLHVLFYVEADSEYANKIDLGFCDEVSVGALPKHAFCSECGYDYRAPGNEFSFYFRECDQGHEIGKNGVHLRLTACEAWNEMSLVNKGASSKPKIVGPAKQRLSKESLDKLAASGASPDTLNLSYLLCPATTSQPIDKGNPMDLAQLSQRVETLSGDKARLEVELQGAKDKLQSSEEALTASQAKVQELESKLQASGDEGLKAQLEAAQAETAKAAPVLEFFKEQAKLGATAAGLTLAEDASLEDMVATLKQAQIKLAAIPRSGKTTPAEGGDDDQSVRLTAAQNSAFLGAK